MYPANDSQLVQQRIQDHAALVKRIAHHLIARLPASVEIQDLIQAGMIGLMDAARAFDEAQGVQFDTFASQRIRGSMIDELRESDWASRSTRKNGRTIEQAIHRLEHRFGRQPLESEIATELNMPLSDYQAMLEDARGHQIIYFDDFRGDDDDGDQIDRFSADHDADPLQQLSDAAFRSTLVAAITRLPEREQLVMSLYYEKELNLKEIGLVLEVSESRVCQLHTQAIARLRTGLADWVGTQTSRKGKQRG